MAENNIKILGFRGFGVVLRFQWKESAHTRPTPSESGLSQVVPVTGMPI